MTDRALTESDVEDAALAWLEAGGWWISGELRLPAASRKAAARAGARDSERCIAWVRR